MLGGSGVSETKQKDAEGSEDTIPDLGKYQEREQTRNPEAEVKTSDPPKKQNLEAEVKTLDPPRKQKSETEKETPGTPKE